MRPTARFSVLVFWGLLVACGKVGDVGKSMFAPTGIVPTSIESPYGMAGGFGTRAVDFPPRNEPLGFRQALESKYRDGLGRGPTSTFVDIEGDIVWTQEYLRYRVNGCDHSDALNRVFLQIDGRGVQPVCGGSTTAFPPRNEPFDFRIQLEAKYRDSLHRGPTSTFVDIEGDIVWTQEYLRYRVSSCSHGDAQTKVFSQIDGRGVQVDCTPLRPPPAPAPPPSPPPLGTGAFVKWTTDSTTCQCGSIITLQINGSNVGTMSCNGSATVPVGPGSYSVRACAGSSCTSPDNITVKAGDTYVFNVFCRTTSTTNALSCIVTQERRK